MENWIVTLEIFERNLARSGGVSWQGLAHGTMRTLLFGPRGRDVQTLQALVSTNHEQDEIYIVLSGHCLFSKNDEFREIGAGDVVFVEAGATHQFHSYSDDFAAWVIFWGPAGGEPKSPAM